MTWKYVMLKVGGQKIPVIFPGQIPHSMMAEVLGDALFHGLRETAAKEFDPQVFSAGFIEKLLVDDVHGSSSTLDLKSDPGDKNVINTHPYLHGA